MAIMTKKSKILYTLRESETHELGQRFTLNQSSGEDDLIPPSNGAGIDLNSIANRLEDLPGDGEPYDGNRLNHKEGKILEDTYNTMSEDGKLTKEEIEQLECIDEILDAADIMVNKNTGDATIVTDSGENKTIEFDPKGRER